MSLDMSGAAAPANTQSVNIVIFANHPLMTLSSLLPWKRLMGIVYEDLKLTTSKGYWWIGRKLIVRLQSAQRSWRDPAGESPVISKVRRYVVGRNMRKKLRNVKPFDKPG